MNVQTIASIAAVVALFVSALALVFNGIQTRNAIRSAATTQTIARGNAVLHFTNRYFDLVKSGDPRDMLGNPKFDYQYWSLVATEFYFFDHGMLPPFMYTLWMIELANNFVDTHGQRVRDSQVEHLTRYSASYPRMIEFFNELNNEAHRCADDNLRNRAVASLINSWADKRKFRAIALE